MTRSVADVFGLLPGQRRAQEEMPGAMPAAEAVGDPEMGGDQALDGPHPQHEEIQEEMSELFGSTYDEGGPEALIKLCYSTAEPEVQQEMTQMLTEDPDQAIDAMVQSLCSSNEACEAWLDFTSALEPTDIGGEEAPAEEMPAPEASADEEPEFKVGDTVEPVDAYGIAGKAQLITGMKEGQYLVGYHGTRIGSFAQVHSSYRLSGQDMTPHHARQAQADFVNAEKEAQDAEKWIVKDWAGNVCFGGQEFDSSSDAESFLSEKLGDKFEEDRQEYEIEKKTASSRVAMKKVAVDSATEQYFMMYFKAYGKQLTRPLVFRKAAAKVAGGQGESEGFLGHPVVSAKTAQNQIGVWMSIGNTFIKMYEVAPTVGGLGGYVQAEICPDGYPPSSWRWNVYAKDSPAAHGVELQRGEADSLEDAKDACDEACEEEYGRITSHRVAQAQPKWKPRKKNTPLQQINQVKKHLRSLDSDKLRDLAMDSGLEYDQVKGMDTDDLFDATVKQMKADPSSVKKLTKSIGESAKAKKDYEDQQEKENEEREISDKPIRERLDREDKEKQNRFTMADIHDKVLDHVKGMDRKQMLDIVGDVAGASIKSDISYLKSMDGEKLERYVADMVAKSPNAKNFAERIKKEHPKKDEAPASAPAQEKKPEAPSSGGGGSVTVPGYTKSDGTVVKPYTRHSNAFYGRTADALPAGTYCPDCGAELKLEFVRHMSSCKQAVNAMPGQGQWDQVGRTEWKLHLPEGTPASISFNESTGDYEWEAGDPGQGDHGKERDLDSAKTKAYSAALSNKTY